MSIHRDDAIKLGVKWEAEMRKSAKTMKMMGAFETGKGNLEVAEAINILLRFVRNPVASEAKVITICGSSRFIDIMAVISWWLECDEGKIVHTLHLLPAWYGEVPDHLAEAEGVADQLDALHLQKIDQSDEVFIVNWDGYIGDSTRNEIAHAQARGLLFRWLCPPPRFHAGTHDAAMYERVVGTMAYAKAQAAGEAAMEDRD